MREEHFKSVSFSFSRGCLSEVGSLLMAHKAIPWDGITQKEALCLQSAGTRSAC